jgi:tetratricopeptide (TPR) repeat protein
VNNVIGRIHLYRGQSREAIAYFRRVLPIAEESGDDELLALPSCLIGTALLAQGNMRRAEPLLAQAAGPLERLGEPFEWFRAVGYHGFSLIALGRYKDGLAELERVHARAREIGQPSLSSAAHLMRCTALTLTGEWPRVLHDGQEVVRLASQTGDKLHLSLAWSNLGWANSSLGRHDEARACRARAVELEKVMGGRLIMSDWYVAADAELALNAGRVEEALEGAMAVAESSRGAELCLSHGIAERVWGAALARAGDAAGCDAHMKTSVEVLEDAGVVFQAARTRLAWALARHARGDVAMAEQLFEEALAVLTAAGCDYTLVEAVRRWYARGETEISPRETA